MPYIKIYIHCVWSTKNRIPFLNTPNLRQQLWSHIISNSKEKGIYIDAISGYSDHCHCLVSLGADQTIQKVMQLIKGESSFWMNKQKSIKQKFEWQNEYFALSISESMHERIKEYIAKQEEHHHKKTFEEEYEEFIQKYNFV